MINFKANYVDKTNITYFNNNQSHPKEVSFVRINPLSKSDIVALRKVNDLWGKSEYGWKIYDSVSGLYWDNVDPEDRDFFALTTQENEFEKLKPESILALCSISLRTVGSKYINYLQVIPKFMHDNREKLTDGLSGIGSAMLSALKDKFKNKSILLHASNNNNVKFYLKNGFELINKDTKYMAYIRK